LINNRFECGFVGDREVGENFAVQSGTGSFQSFGIFSIRFRRARLAGAFVALGIVVLPRECFRGSSFSELLFRYRSFRPRSLIYPATSTNSLASSGNRTLWTLASSVPFELVEVAGQAERSRAGN
jgi:hypothetical protein